ncbi:MAG: ion transporter [Rhodobacteraceae bacterium]|nr:ion transporter [Paracoccaceae bacterium]
MARDHGQASDGAEATPQTPLQQVVHSEIFRWSVTILILVNAIIIGMQTSDQINAQFGDLLNWIDSAILCVFVAELGLRLIADRFDAFKSGWFWFDVTVVAVALLPLPGNLSVIRTLRVLRVLRLLSVSQKMRRVVAGLLNAIPGMATVIGVLAVVFYVFAVFATETFGEGTTEDAQTYFGTLGSSLFTLFQIMTLEDWSSIARSFMAEYAWAWLFFLVFVVVTAFAVLNLFIGIIVDAMQDDREEALQDLRDKEEAADQERFDLLLNEIKQLRTEVAELRTIQEGRETQRPDYGP